MPGVPTNMADLTVASKQASKQAGRQAAKRTKQSKLGSKANKLESKQDSHEKLIAKDLENFELKLQTLSTEVGKITSTLEGMAKNINGTSIMVTRYFFHFTLKRIHYLSSFGVID